MAQKRADSELAVITKAKDLCRYVCRYVLDVTHKSPKAFRFTFVSRLQVYALEIVEHAFRANDVFVKPGDGGALARRREYQHRALTSVRLLCYMGLLAMECRCILLRQYEQIARLSADCQNMLGAWINSDKKRFSLPEASKEDGLGKL